MKMENQSTESSKKENMIQQIEKLPSGLKPLFSLLLKRQAMEQSTQSETENQSLDKNSETGEKD